MPSHHYQSAHFSTFLKVVIDVVGPLPITNNKIQFILGYTDDGSRYPEAIPLIKMKPQKSGRLS